MSLVSRGGVSAGSAFRLISWRKMAASVSDTSSPWKQRVPVSIS
jgi:hypothetical protein